MAALVGTNLTSASYTIRQHFLVRWREHRRVSRKLSGQEDVRTLNRFKFKFQPQTVGLAGNDASVVSIPSVN